MQLVDLDQPAVAPIGPLYDSRKVRDWALVLRSMQIPFEVTGYGPPWTLVVSPADQVRAMEAIRLFEQENRNWPPRRLRERLPYPRTLIAPALMLAMVAFFLVTGPVAAGSPWFSHGIASSERVLHGEPWRAVTALTLHADSMHVLGNALSGTLFLSAVNRRLGDGRGSFFVLVAGALGNLVNAAYHRVAHNSLGASTAVFAAVGVLVATQLVLDRQESEGSFLQRAAPVVGGLALLGMLGASPHSDLLAHLFGLLAGIVVGIPVAMLSKSERPSSWLVQAAWGLSGVGLVAGAWLLAFARG